jgi:eukaryotic-like serine/threonine-protein kinase
MTADEWARVCAVFDAAMEQPPAERATWLDLHCGDASTRAEVAAMLHSFDTDPDFLEQPVDDVASVSAAVAANLVGRRLGAYRIVAEIGRGGMGVVYEAERVDHEFDRRVAIKILPVWGGSALVERFGLERRVLAGLDHRGIARLFDSGTTDDAVPYFVMELVEGLPIDVWCRDRRLSLAERVSLVERVCDALAYAHRHLVIHRDVKPANVLVAKDGQPKLLDFGIAAIMGEDGASAAGRTRTGHHSFTADFASPEQVRGERVTTASDVYSLAVTTYLILAGRLPHRLDALSPLEQLRTICEVDPPLMSVVAPETARGDLRGDLDAVVAKALAKAPGDRYGTVAEFAADLRAWREGRPVTAGPQTVAYRARRFVGRNRKAVAAAAAFVVALGGGGVATAWQARIAAVERDKAQNRFRQVQEFSRSLLFEVHDALRAVPGATESRRLLLDRAVQFLDGLAADADTDTALKLELADGYRKLANVQGNQMSENLGDTGAALASIAKATRLLDEVRAAQPADLDALLLSIEVAYHRATATSLREDADMHAAAARHEALVTELDSWRSQDPRAIHSLAKAYSDIGSLKTDRDDFTAGERAYRHAMQLFESLPPDERRKAERQEAYALKRLGAVLLRLGRFDESEMQYRRALAIERATLARPDVGESERYDITFTLSDLALVLSRRGKWDDAVAMWTDALGRRRAVSDADPKNVRARSGVATLHGRLGTAAMASGNAVDAVTHYRRELDERERLLRDRGQLPATKADRAWAALRLAEALFHASGPGETGRASLAEARRLVESVSRLEGKPSVAAGSEPGFLELYDTLAESLAPQRAR